MHVRKGFGSCFWLTMFFFALIGLVTFPYGIAIWAVQIWAAIKILRTPYSDD